MTRERSQEWKAGDYDRPAARIARMRRSASQSFSAMTSIGPERIGRSTPKPVSLRYSHCRLKVRCAGVELDEPMRRMVGVCKECTRYMNAKKPAGMSIGEWLLREGYR